MRLPAISIAAMSCALFLTGCATAAPPMAHLNAKPVSGGELTISITSDPVDWDPSFNGRSNTALSYESLLGFKTGPDIGLTEVILQPALAERWEVSPDARTFTFYLRKGVKFADVSPVNGREMTSADVKWTMDYRTRTGDIKDKKLPVDQLAFMFEGMNSVETPDPYTAVISFKEPFLPFINYAGSQWNPILPREIYEQDGHLRDQIVGTGPYILDHSNIQKGTRWSFIKNRNYWGEGKPYIDSIRQFVIPDEATRFAAFQTKQLDVLDNLAYPAFKQVTQASPNVETFKYFAVQSSFIFLSQAKGGPLTDVRVRRAIGMGVDRDELNRVVAGGEGQWALPGVMPGLFTETEVKQHVKQDIEQAKQLMQQAGYGNGIKLVWSIASNDSQANMTIYQLIQAQLKRIGVEVVLNPMDPTDRTTKRRNGDFELDFSTSATGSLTMDLDSWVYGRYHGYSTGNYTKANDPELNMLLEASRREIDPAKRLELQRKASLRIYEMGWSANLIYEPIYAVWHSRVHDYFPWFSDKAPYRQSWIQS